MTITANADRVSTPVGQEIQISPLDNDDISGAIGFVRLDQILFGPSNGSLTVPEEGPVTYTPNAGFQGRDSFDYTIVDTGGSDVSRNKVTILVGDNRSPIAVTDQIITTPGQSVLFVPSANDSDPDGDPISISLDFGLPPDLQGNVSEFVNLVRYTASADFVGEERFTYVVADDRGGTGIGDVIVNVVEAIPPVANDDTATTMVNTPVIIPVLANDDDPNGDNSALRRFSTEFGPGISQISQTLDQSLNVTPVADFTGEATFTYTIRDESGQISEPATVRINVTAPPVFVPANPTAPFQPNDDFVSTQAGTPITLPFNDLLSNDNGNVTDITQAFLAENGTVSLAADARTITFTPNAGFAGDASFIYNASDSTGAIRGARVTVQVAEGRTPNPIEQAPVLPENPAVNNPVADAPAPIVPTNPSVPLQALDDTFDAVNGQARVLSFAELLGNDNGNVTGVAGAILPTNGTVAVDQTAQTVTFTPNAVGTSDFIYNAVDSTGALSGARVTLNVAEGSGTTPPTIPTMTPPTTTPTAPNGPPVALDDMFTTAQDTSRTLSFSDLFGNDTNVTGIQGIILPTNGTVSVDQTAQTVTFTPTAGFTGTADFIYNATNGTELDGARVTIEVAAMQMV